MANRRFAAVAAIDVIRETFHLVRARRTYFLVLLSIFVTAVFLNQSLADYREYTLHRTYDTRDKGETSSCSKNILEPWLASTFAHNLSAAQHNDFYSLALQNCTMFKLPPEATGSYNFINGTFRFSHKGHWSFKLAIEPTATVHSALSAVDLLMIIWRVWAQVAVAWGLHPAHTTAPSTNRRAPSTRRQKLTGVIREQFSGTVLRGIVRVALTNATALYFLELPFGLLCTSMLGTTVEWGRSHAHHGIDTFMRVVQPLVLLTLLSSTAAALEDGMWGFKALWRGSKLAKGNRWNSLFVHLPLSLWEYVCRDVIRTYLYRRTTLQQSRSLMSLAKGSLFAVIYLPRFFELPVFYSLCKYWREKGETMA